MAVIETTHVGWLSRLLGSIKSVLVGLVLAVVAVPLLFWNEGRAVHTARSLEEGAGAVLSVPADRVDPANEGMLVHVTGEATAVGKLADPTFGVETTALSLHRDVEMFQWDEERHTKTKKKLGGGRTKRTRYTYERDWRDRVIDSSDFKEPGHSNPTRMPYEDKAFHPKSVSLEAFTLSREHVAELGRGDRLDVGATRQPAAPEGERPRQRHDGKIYIGEDPQQPRVGDVRVGYTRVPPGVVSLIAKQQGTSFQAWTAPSGDALLMLERGSKSADEMFQGAERANTGLTWALRLAGFLCMFVGVGVIFRPLAVVGDVLPLVGSVLRFGVALFAFLVSTLVSSVVVAVAWLVYRPVIGVALLLVAGAAVFGLVRLARSGSRPASAT